MWRWGGASYHRGVDRKETGDAQIPDRDGGFASGRRDRRRRSCSPDQAMGTGLLSDMPLFSSAAELDESNCRLICPIAAAMVGVCLTGIGILQVAVSVARRSTLADDLLAIDALFFLTAMLSSYFALRLQSAQRLHRLEQLADKSFIAAMILMTGACFVITYALHF